MKEHDDHRNTSDEIIRMAEEFLGTRARVKAKRVVGQNFKALELPKGPQLFTDWRFVQPGQLSWVSGKTGDPFELKSYEIDGPIDAKANPVDVPDGIRLRAQPARKSDPFPTDLGPGGIIVPHEGRYLSWSGVGVITYLESDDGWDWQKKAECTIDFDAVPQIKKQSGSYGIFIDPSCTENERFKMIIRHNPQGMEYRKKLLEEFAQTRPDDIDPFFVNFRSRNGFGKFSCMYGAVSPDGIHWRVNKKPLILQFSDTTNNIHYDPDLKRYVWYSRNNWYYDRRCIGRSESESFLSFPAPRTIVIPELDDHPADDWYTNSKTVYPGSEGYHFLFPAKYNRATEGSEIHLFSSPDGLIWNRVPKGPVLRTGKPGSWDGGCVFCGFHLIPLDGDAVALPYGGYAYPHKYPRNDFTMKRGTAYAMWKKERLCALEAEESGSFATFPFLASGNSLRLNALVPHAGEVRIEVADQKGRPLPGRSFAESDAISGDSTDHSVTWKGKKELNTGPGQPIMLRFRMKAAKLFAFEIPG